MQLFQTVLLLVIAGVLISSRRELLRRSFTHRRRLIIDSCGLIDGRIAEIVRTGFLTDELVIPQFIISELQLLADGNDSHKRERARYGLDIANELQDSATAKVTIDRTVFPEIESTDDKLIALAKKLRGGELYTTDFNLGKVAAIEGVHVRNVNELAQSLRPVALPGEALQINILQKGSNRGQGVGYLDDGTMIVIDGGERFIGKTVPVTVTRMHQTVAGKMVFGMVKEPQLRHGTKKETSQSKENTLQQNSNASDRPASVKAQHNPLSKRISHRSRRAPRV